MINDWVFKYLVYYPVVLLRRQHVWRYLGELRASQYLSRPDLNVLQLSKLRSLLAHAAETVPYYRSKWGGTVPSVRGIEDLNQLGSVTKTDVKTASDLMISRAPGYGLTKKTTGGSTGQPVTILKNADAMARELAATWRGYSWAGIDIGDKQGRFWGVPLGRNAKCRARLIDFVTHRQRCSAFSFVEQTLDYYTRKLVSFEPKYFYGYVSMLVEYARYFERRGQHPPFELKCIITTSEVLTTKDRALLEAVFSTRVFNEYGSGELGSVAHECENGNLHVMAENMIVEVLDGDRPCVPGEVGELVITELNNRTMPLIRYRTGDLASLSEQECACGRELPIIEKLVGRAYDMIRNRQGRMFHGEFFMYIFEEAKRRDLGIGAFQVVQEAPNRLRLRIRPEEGYGWETQQFIRKWLARDFDPQVELYFEKVDQIQREASGKMKLIVGMGGVSCNQKE